MKNSSGFHGYSLATVYPDMGDMVSQTMVTIVDPEEQEALSGIEPDKTVSPAVSRQSKGQIWFVLGALIGLIVIFGVPKG